MRKLDRAHAAGSGPRNLTKPVYAYNSIVIPVGTGVRGHLAHIDSGSKLVRARAYLNGNFSPPTHAVLRFDTVLFESGGDMPIDALVKGGIPRVTQWFLFERVQVPNQAPRALLGALHAIDVGSADRVAVDDEVAGRSGIRRLGSFRRRCLKDDEFELVTR